MTPVKISEVRFCYSQLAICATRCANQIHKAHGSSGEITFCQLPEWDFDGLAAHPQMGRSDTSALVETKYFSHRDVQRLDKILEIV
jgi:hypothetical protein